MSRSERIRKRLLVEPGTIAGLNDRDPAWTGGAEFEPLSEDKLTSTAKEILRTGVEELSELRSSCGRPIPTRAES
jgi:hypothetical protein